MAQFRIDETAWNEFRAACKDAGTDASKVLRDLCWLSTVYMREHGKWVVPVLTPDPMAGKTEALRLALSRAGPNGEVLMGVLEQIVERTLNKRMIAAESNGSYVTEAGAAAVQRQPITPQAAPIAGAPAGRCSAAPVDRKKKTAHYHAP